MTKIFGDFRELNEGFGEYLKIGFLPNSISLQQRWRNDGLSADFLAGYVSTFFPLEDGVTPERQDEIKDAVSYIANEVIENAMKYSYSISQHTVSIEMFLEADSINLYTVNSIDPARIETFQTFIQRLLTEDPDELYMEQLESNADDENDGASGLGFLTMINDYGTTLAWRFVEGTEGDKETTVTTMVRLPV